VRDDLKAANESINDKSSKLTDMLREKEDLSLRASELEDKVGKLELEREQLKLRQKQQTSNL